MKSRSFSASHAALLVSRLGGARSWKETGQQTQGISHTIRCHAQCINQAKAAAWEMVGHWSASGGQLHCATFVLYILSILSLLLLLFSLSY